MNPVIQCVPNFSEGRDPSKVESIVDAARGASAARIADYSFDPDHNRLVVTFLGGRRRYGVLFLPPPPRRLSLLICAAMPAPTRGSALWMSFPWCPLMG